MRVFISLLFIGSLISTAFSQDAKVKKYLTYDFQLVVDNDAFTLDLTKDQYYSSGIYPMVRYLMDSSAKAKKIRTFQLNHRIFTPKWIGWEDEAQLDRPYAGNLSISASNEYYFHSNQYLKAQLELGWMGPGSLVGQTQRTWHRWFGMPEPMGWKFQINDTPIINLNLTYIRPFYSSYNFELSSESNVSAGTLFNHIRQEIIVRMGQLKPLHQSAFVSSSLGNKRIKLPEPKLEEVYFFYAPGAEYVIHNSTIDGNWIGKPSAFTKESINWLWQHRAGVMFSWSRFDLAFTAVWRTQENKEATNHNYVAIRMNQRF